MRILFLTHYFPPEGNAPATRVHAMARHWVRAGHEVDVITCAPNVPSGRVYEGYRNALWQRETIDGVGVTRVWTYLAANAGFAPRIANYASFLLSGTIAGLLARRPDVVIATSPQPFCGIAGAVTATLRRTPFVLEVRDIWPDSVSAVGAMKNRRALGWLEALARGMHASADHIVTVGEGYRRELERKGVASERIEVVPNGVDAEFFVPSQKNPETRRRWGLGDDFVCSYVGTVGMAAGLDVVLSAARKLRDEGRDGLRFLVVGDGAERERLEASARAQGLDTVVFTGRLPKEDVRDVLATSDACLVHLRSAEIFRTVLPSKMFEAAAMRKPVILGVRGEAQDLLEEAQAGIAIEPESAEQLVHALERLRSAPQAAEAMGQNGLDFFGRHYDRASLASRYADLLAQIVMEPAALPQEADIPHTESA